jgi:EmrB/QacA subfamily drug resistance transporter
VPPSRRPWALLAVSLANFTTVLDNNVTNVALPSIQRDLHLSPAGLEWVVSSYVLAFAGLLLAGGRFADALGRRRVLLVGLVVFAAASLAAGLAGSDAVLIAARAVQGVGAALIAPTTLAVISSLFRDPAERTRAVSLWAAVAGLALAAGPLVGGLLSEHASWGWIFFLNVPISAVVVGLVVWAVPESRETVRRRLDLPGLGASVVALTALTWALIEGPGRGWTSAWVLGAFVVAAAAGAGFLAVERWTAVPMVDLSLFRSGTFSGGLIALVLWAFGLFGIYFFTALWLQDALGFSPTEAGLAFLPMAALMVIGAVFSGRLAQRTGTARLVAGAMVLMAAGIASLILLGADAAFAQLMPGFALIGLGGGLVNPLTASVLGTMPHHRAGVAAGLLNTARQLGGLLGVTVLGVLLTSRQTAELRDGAAPLEAFVSGYRLALVGSAGLMLVGGLVAYLALRGADRRTSAAVTAEASVEPVPAG